MQELAEKVWTNPVFQKAMQNVHLAWLQTELGTETNEVSPDDADKLMRAAAILSCSVNQEHRKAAFRIATCAYELFGTQSLPMDQALRVVLARLGNFPSFSTRKEVETAGKMLPLALATEEAFSLAERKVTFNRRDLSLTNFQHELWISLVEKKRVALAAPTSAGKSFVLQNYLSLVFSEPADKSVIYIVPTRALITQVAEDIEEQFTNFEGQQPDIITMPVEAETVLPDRAIYVMTQERVQLGLMAHPEFNAHIIIADEAHGIADGSRGILLQWVIDDLLQRNPETQILFASPTIKNLEVFGRLFGLKDVIRLASTEPTVGQNFLIVEITVATKGKISIHTVGDGHQIPNKITTIVIGQTIASRIDKLVHISAIIGKDQSNIIYANGAGDAEKIALQLSDLFSDREPTIEQLELADLAKEVVHPNYVLTECIKRGIAFHYSNIPAQLRQAIEDAVSAGHINYLVCTSTLLQGVNLPVKNIFMCMPEKGQHKPLESSDFWNLSGRAGRLRREFQGNIFLIDYNNWKKKPLDGPKDESIVPAIENSVQGNSTQLINIITDTNPVKANEEKILELETAFVRLFSDLKQGKLLTTLNRLGIAEDTEEFYVLSSALNIANDKVILPEEIIRKTPNVSAYKQQKIFEYFKSKIAKEWTSAKALIPLHPREGNAYQSYVEIFKLCHEFILERDVSKNGSYKFYALLALWWMQGKPLPFIISNQIEKNPKKNQRAIIRETLEDIEKLIRFQAVRFFGCYNTLLAHALENAGLVDFVSSIPALPMYLEVGASDKTMISFISLGLSRVTAMKLNDQSVRKDLDMRGALDWLKSRPLNMLDLSPLLLAEVRKIISENLL